LQSGDPDISDGTSSSVEELAATPGSFVANAAPSMEAETSSSLHRLQSFFVDGGVTSGILASAT
jgi:hypothetical protein